MTDAHADVAEALRLSHRRWPVRRVVAGSVVAAIGLLGAGIVITRARHGAPPQPLAAPYTVGEDHVDVKDGAPTWHYVELAQATLADPIPPEPVPGRVAFDEGRSVPIVAPLPGHVDTVGVRLGQQVQAHDRLIAVRSAALVDLRREADLLRAEEAARNKAVERLRALVQLKAVPEKDLIAAQQDLRQSQLSHEAAELKLRSLPVTSDDNGTYWITAPRAGVVVERTVLVGQEVGPDRSDPLLIVGELDQVIVTADVPETAVAELRIGQPAMISSPAAPDRRLAGTVEYIGAVVDPVRRMINVRVRVANDDRTLRPNAFVQVAFTITGSPRVVVPTDAVVTDDERSFVFVQLHEPAHGLQRREVITGRQREGRVEIASGLTPGETYVGKGALLLLNAIDLAN